MPACEKGGYSSTQKGRPDQPCEALEEGVMNLSGALPRGESPQFYCTCRVNINDTEEGFLDMAPTVVSLCGHFLGEGH